MNMPGRSLIVLTFLLVWQSTLQAQRFTRRIRVHVSGPTQMDWLYPLLLSSPETVPAGMLQGYKSTEQRYDLYAPPVGSVAQALPLIIFVSYRDTPMGWDYLGPTCVANGVVYVEPYKAGNSNSPALRVRRVLDALDDVRRKYPIDPDRTYIAGYSGGGGVASRIALTIPEYFGGCIASSISFPPPTSPWQLDRARQRLSIASIVGEKESPGFEMGRVQVPIMKRMGIRAECSVVPMLGHGTPPPRYFDAAFHWLDQAAPQRSLAAGKRAALRITGNPSRQQWAAAMLSECKALLVNPETIHVGLGLLNDLHRRWPDLVEGQEAKSIFNEYQTKDDRPWVEDAKRERLAITAIMADIYELATQQTIGLTKVRRATYAQGAINNLRILVRDSSDETVAHQASERIPNLQKLVSNVPGRNGTRIPDGSKSNARMAFDPIEAAEIVDADELEELPVNMTFTLVGTQTAEKLLQTLQREFSADTSRISIKRDRIRRAGLTLERPVIADFEDRPLNEILHSILTPLGLKYQLSDNSIEIVPAYEFAEKTD